MGGHGGLNILPQKRWNVYNYENREKVRRDEEAAAREEQLEREQSRKRESGLRLEKLRQARGLSSSSRGADVTSEAAASNPPEPEVEPESDSKHINLFEGIRIFDPVKIEAKKEGEKKGRFDVGSNKKMKKQESVRAVGPEDEKYRLGYGLAGKGAKLPWYMEKREVKNTDENEENYDNDDYEKSKKKSGGKKSLQELREERLQREKKEKERERALIMEKSRKDRGFSLRR